MSQDDISAYEDSINSNMSNEDIINLYHSTNPTGKPYIIDDKLNDRIRVYINGQLHSEYPAIHGKYSKIGGYFNKRVLNQDNTFERDINGNYIYKNTQVDPDEMTITYPSENGEIENLQGNLTTPAGIYYTRRDFYNGNPTYMRLTRKQLESGNTRGIPSSIHVREIKEGANTNGCTGISCSSMQELDKLLSKYQNVPSYILPASDKNRFAIRNGQLIFKSGDIQKTPSDVKISYNPISKITYNSSGLEDYRKDIINKFSRSLITNKAQLQKDLGINSDTYNELLKYSLGILGVETNYGEENSGIGNFLRAAQKAISSNNSSPDYKSKYYTYSGNKDNNSIGLTQMRISYLGENEKKLFQKYGITKKDLVDSPEKAAIATMIKLASEYKNQGLNYDRAIKSWNNRQNYLDRVKKSSSRFIVYQNYRKKENHNVNNKQNTNLLSEGINKLKSFFNL